MPLSREYQIPEAASGGLDLFVHPHEITRPFQQASTSLLQRVRLQTLLIPPDSWKANGDRSAELVATLRSEDGFPVLIAKPFGLGRVLLCTTTAPPEWNNWALDGSFPLGWLMIEDYLAAGRIARCDYRLGQSVFQRVRAGEFQSESVFARFDPESPRRGIPIDLPSAAEGAESQFVTFPPSPPDMPATVGRAGVYEWILKSSSQQLIPRRWAMNVDAETESDLHYLSPAELKALAPNVRMDLVPWDQVAPQTGLADADDASRLLLGLLASVLLLERWLAYLNTYPLTR
jgi:hypothetical protein